jgi:hypothetical protein
MISHLVKRRENAEKTGKEGEQQCVKGQKQ